MKAPPSRSNGRCRRFLRSGGTWSALLVWGLMACDADVVQDRPSGSPPEPMGGEEIQRLVTLSPVATRFAVELGVAERVVGTDAESARMALLPGAPIVDLRSAHSVGPDIILIPALEDADPTAVIDLESRGTRIIEFAPHDIEDTVALTRGVGTMLVGTAAALRFERRFSRPLALVGGASPPYDRARILAVVDLDPLTIAGGHSFETDLIEIGGGTSATHGGEEAVVRATPEIWDALAPDLVLVTTLREPTAGERRIARHAIPDRYPVAYFQFDRTMFWLDQPEEDAERMRQLIASFTRN